MVYNHRGNSAETLVPGDSLSCISRCSLRSRSEDVQARREDKDNNQHRSPSASSNCNPSPTAACSSNDIDYDISNGLSRVPHARVMIRAASRTPGPSRNRNIAGTSLFERCSIDGGLFPRLEPPSIRDARFEADTLRQIGFQPRRRTFITEEVARRHSEWSLGAVSSTESEGSEVGATTTVRARSRSLRARVKWAVQRASCMYSREDKDENEDEKNHSNINCDRTRDRNHGGDAHSHAINEKGERRRRRRRAPRYLGTEKSSHESSSKPPPTPTATTTATPPGRIARLRKRGFEASKKALKRATLALSKWYCIDDNWELAQPALGADYDQRHPDRWTRASDPSTTGANTTTEVPDHQHRRRHKRPEGKEETSGCY